MQYAHYSIVPNSVYVPQSVVKLLVNKTLDLTGSLLECSKECLAYQTCRTANYDSNTQMCSLYNERSTYGQILNATNPTSSILIMKTRDPASKC